MKLPSVPKSDTLRRPLRQGVPAKATPIRSGLLLQGGRKEKNKRHGCYISLLPLELLIEILLLTINPSNWTMEELRTLASVSTTWQRIIKNTPRFWPLLDSGHTPKVWSKVLKMNPTGRLEVQCWSRSETCAKALILAVKPELHRVSSLIFCTRALPGAFEAFGDGPSFPLLEDLTVDCWNDTPTTPLMNFGDGVHFRHVALGRVALRWDTPRLRGLKTLALNLLRNNIPAPQELHAILSSSPGLQSLSLSDWDTARVDDYAAFDPPSSIQLSQLLDLEIERLPHAVHNYLISAITAAPARTISWTGVAGQQQALALVALSSKRLMSPTSLEITWASRKKTICLASNPFPLVSRKTYGSRGIPGINIEAVEVDDHLEIFRGMRRFLSPDTRVTMPASLSRVLAEEILREIGREKP